MSRFFNRKSVAFILVALALVAGVLGTVAIRGNATQSHAAAPKAHSNVGTTTQSPQKFCDRVKSGQIQVSAGARMYCFGPQNGNGSPAAANHKPTPGSKTTFGTNVDAANPQEDIAPNGTQAYGQSEVSVAGVGRYVVEAWNDATGFFSPCPSPMNKEELTGYGFSADNGKHFTDQGGLPN